MSDISARGLSARVAGAACAAGLVGALVLALPARAEAASLDELQAAQDQVSAANEAYSEASGKVEELQAQIDENEARIAEIEAELPELRERASDSIRVLYKMQQSSGSLIELILSAEDFYDLVSLIQYLDVIQSHNSDAVEELASAATELEEARAELDTQMSAAEEERQRAADALAEAESARAELQAQVEAQAAAEEAERQAAIAAAQAEAEAAASATPSTDATFTTESGNQAPVEVPAAPDPGPVDWQSEKGSFVSTWGARIDAYLAGSPMAGLGTTFAEAAWEYGVDPRFSPAIAMVESSLGRNCFKPHNAWGWGSASWGSWEEAIWAHVAGLASGYGGQLTYAGAKKYCPPNADHWYASVLANMEKI